MMVVWKDVVGFEGIYVVSNTGDVVRIKKATSTWAGRKLKFDIGKQGYARVVLFKDGKRSKHMVQRIVCAAFHGPCPSGYEAHHKNEIKLDNNENNLEWLSPQKNKEQSFLNSGKKCFWPSETYIFVSPTGEQFTHKGLNEFCQKHGLDPGAMSCVSRGEYKQHKGWSCVKV